MDTIGMVTKNAITQAIGALLREKIHDINEAYEAEGELNITLAVKMGNQTPKGVNIAVQMQFVKQKVKTEARFGLFDDLGPGVDSVTVQSGDSDLVTLYERPAIND